MCSAMCQNNLNTKRLIFCSSRTSAVIWILLFPLLTSPLSVQAETNSCLSCHVYQASDFSPAHAFAYSSCVSCHLGDQAAAELPQAHEDLIAKPGDLHKDRTICAACHPRQAGNVMNSLMNSGKGLVQKTRLALGEGDHPHIDAGLKSLGDSPADSMLRKLCARCHLAHAAAHPAADVTQAGAGVVPPATSISGRRNAIPD